MCRRTFLKEGKEVKIFGKPWNVTIKILGKPQFWHLKILGKPQKLYLCTRKSSYLHRWRECLDGKSMGEWRHGSRNLQDVQPCSLREQGVSDRSEVLGLQDSCLAWCFLQQVFWQGGRALSHLHQGLCQGRSHYPASCFHGSAVVETLIWRMEWILSS